MSCSVCKIYKGFPECKLKDVCASDVTELTRLFCMPLRVHVAEVWCVKVQTGFAVQQELNAVYLQSVLHCMHTCWYSSKGCILVTYPTQ